MANKVESDASLKLQLKTKQICRFCCSTNDSLSHIYSAENRIKSKAPLPLQIITITSIEVSYRVQLKVRDFECFVMVFSDGKFVA